MYKFDPAGPPVDETFRAIALSQLDEAIADLESGEGGNRKHERIHSNSPDAASISRSPA